LQKIINFFRGSVRLEVSGPFPERFLNLCAQEYLSFWGIQWLADGGLRVTVSRRDCKRAKALGERVQCTVETAAAQGVPAFLARFRRRYALLLGMALSLAAVCVLSQVILSVEVTGNETVSTAEIVTELRRLGLRPGAYGPGVDESAVSQELLVRVEDLSWCAVNLHGTRAEVIVREAVPKPELPDETICGDIVARAPGLVIGMEVEQGEPAAAEGVTVLEGDVLIAGNVQNPVPQYSGLEPGRRLVRAQGRVYARTWRVLTAEIPLEAEVKSYTGAEEHRWALHILGWRVNFYGNSGISFAEYDKITDVWTARLPSGQEMPLSLSRETVRAYDTAAAEVDADAARAMLEERLLAAVTEQVGKGEVLSAEYSARVADGKLAVTITAECREEIGRFVPFPEGTALPEEQPEQTP